MSAVSVNLGSARASRAVRDALVANPHRWEKQIRTSCQRPAIGEGANRSTRGRVRSPEKTLVHLAHSAGATVAAIAGVAFGFNCCAVITNATEPMMRPAAINVRTLKVSPANAAPSNTATMGFT